MEWGNDGKTRPVLAFVVNKNNVDIYQITTQYKNKSGRIKDLYFKINDWVQAGLKKQSYVDTGTLITLSLDTFKDKTPVGKLTENDKKRLLKFFENNPH
jgi:mRNA interferase MazF